METLIQQPYKGRWILSREGVNIGVVNGDYGIGFTAQDFNSCTLGRYTTPEDALGAVMYVADTRALEDIWLL